ncbi:MAG: hypothetical protein EPO65_02005 [Dehalococcoidia bacterium]|nr:MAG: hypothetical protein EPO65_02005 [Dehalococcoidia bacterium]
MSMTQLARLTVVVAAFCLIAGCDRADRNAVPATPAPTATSTPAEGIATASPTPRLPATPLPGSTAVAATVVLVDARTGVATTLYTDSDRPIGPVAFIEDSVRVPLADRSLGFRLDGSPMTSPPAVTPTCRTSGSGVEVAGKQFSGVACGSISPDLRWMTYMVQTGEVAVGTTGYRVLQHDMWLVDLQSGATRRLQAGLVHCGGCDGRYGPRWSPSSKYVAYAEFGGERRRFLSDVGTGTTRPIGSGNEIHDAPEWAPRGDLLAYSTTANGKVARLEELAAGSSRELPIAWPVRFDASGLFLYSPAWATAPKSGPSTVSTSIMRVDTGKVVATLGGAPPAELLWTGGSAVARYGNSEGYVAVLQQATSCAGTAIYGEGVPQPTCVKDGAQGQISPDGFRVAVARATGAAGPAHGPGFSSTSLPRYDIEVVNMVGGGSRTVVTGAISFIPPLMLWNPAGTHLLIVWPQAGGL